MNGYFRIVRYSIGSQAEVPNSLETTDWKGLYQFALKQSIVGVIFCGIKNMNAKETGLPLPLLYEWVGVAEQIKRQNILLNKRAVEVSLLWEKAGFRNCLLKGQGNALLYPEVYSRTSGDIDLWIEGTRKDIFAFVKEQFPQAHSVYTHIDFPVFDDAEVEAHYIPSSLYSPKYNRRLQEFFQEKAEEQFTNRVELPDGVGGINVPTCQFNLVQQLAHIMNHFFVEGIGLRQFIDYYYLLKSVDVTVKQEMADLLKYLGLLRFAAGVMWIMKDVLGMDEELLIVEPDPKIGTIILKEIEEGGNFGFHDKRYAIRNKGTMARGIADTYRLIKLAKFFPSESVWNIRKKVVNQFWKK